MLKGWVIRAIREVVAIRPPPTYLTPFITIPSHTLDALDANDAVGDEFKIAVPVSGIIQSARFIDRSDTNTAFDVALLEREFVGAAGDAAFSLSDQDALLQLDLLVFGTIEDNTDNRALRIINRGVVYAVPPAYPGARWGWMFAQGIARGAPTIVLGNEPMVSIGFLPDFPLTAADKKEMGR